MNNAADAQRDPNAAAHSPVEGEGQTIDPLLLKRAMKAFRKRLKLTKLDEESRLGRNPLTGGKKSSVVAIMPPYGYPDDVWKELARQGKLKDVGRGFYELIE